MQVRCRVADDVVVICKLLFNDSIESSSGVERRHAKNVQTLCHLPRHRNINRYAIAPWFCGPVFPPVSPSSGSVWWPPLPPNPRMHCVYVRYQGVSWFCVWRLSLRIGAGARALVCP